MDIDFKEFFYRFCGDAAISDLAGLSRLQTLNQNSLNVLKAAAATFNLAMYCSKASLYALAKPFGLVTMLLTPKLPRTQNCQRHPNKRDTPLE